MSTPIRSAAARIGALVTLCALLAGCGAQTGLDLVGAGHDGADVTLTANTCWTSSMLGADPQAVLRLANTYGVTYFQAAQALVDRPAFRLTEACSSPHHVEVYRTIPADRIRPQITSYGTLLEPAAAPYVEVAAAMRHACMDEPLAAAAASSGVVGAVVAPALPDGVELGWAPPSPDQWAHGQRNYACTLISRQPVAFRYASVFGRSYPSYLRICIDNSPLAYVPCSHRHQREEIAVIDVRAAVAAGKFPGAAAIKANRTGRYVDVAPTLLHGLDRACTTYLQAISRTKVLTGVAEIDPTRWPTATGAYPVTCEADVRPPKPSVSATGSVYDR